MKFRNANDKNLNTVAKEVGYLCNIFLFGQQLPIKLIDKNLIGEL